jgi:hypothetical protein
MNKGHRHNKRKNNTPFIEDKTAFIENFWVYRKLRINNEVLQVTAYKQHKLCLICYKWIIEMQKILNYLKIAPKIKVINLRKYVKHL